MADKYTCLGLMSGTSLDGIDAAVLEVRRAGAAFDIAAGEALTLAYTDTERAILRAALDAARQADSGEAIAAADQLVTRKHIEIVAQFRQQYNADIDLIGFHGQTILHAPAAQKSWQIGDPKALARATGCKVVGDLRQADLQAGGQGAPLVPAYHQYLCRDLPKPCAVLNIGGVANLTFIAAHGQMLAFDTGPGNALLDDWVLARAGVAYDADGALAARGTVAQGAVDALLAADYFDQAPPKSLDRLRFDVSGLADLSAADGAASLTAFSVQAVERASVHLPDAPRQWIVCGGGRHNKTMMAALAVGLDAPVQACEAFGWRGDFIEAEAFALLAALSAWDMPISFPMTTGVAAPMSGGVMYAP